MVTGSNSAIASATAAHAVRASWASSAVAVIDAPRGGNAIQTRS